MRTFKFTAVDRVVQFISVPDDIIDELKEDIYIDYPDISEEQKSALLEKRIQKYCSEYLNPDNWIFTSRLTMVCEEVYNNGT